jgi:hypothetical protein
MIIHTRKLPTFALYAAYTDEFDMTVFGSCRDEAINNLAAELAARRGQASAPAGQGTGQVATERKSDAVN